MELSKRTVSPGKRQHKTGERFGASPKASTAFFAAALLVDGSKGGPNGYESATMGRTTSRCHALRKTSLRRRIPNQGERPNTGPGGRADQTRETPVPAPRVPAGPLKKQNVKKETKASSRRDSGGGHIRLKSSKHRKNGRRVPKNIQNARSVRTRKQLAGGVEIGMALLHSQPDNRFSAYVTC